MKAQDDTSQLAASKRHNNTATNLGTLTHRQRQDVGERLVNRHGKTDVGVGGHRSNQCGMARSLGAIDGDTILVHERYFMKTWTVAVLCLAAGPMLAQRMPDGDWPMYTRDLTGSRYSPLGQINARNVAKLQRAWTYRLRSEAEKSQASILRRRNRFP